MKLGTSNIVYKLYNKKSSKYVVSRGGKDIWETKSGPTNVLGYKKTISSSFNIDDYEIHKFELQLTRIE